MHATHTYRWSVFSVRMVENYLLTSAIFHPQGQKKNAIVHIVLHLYALKHGTSALQYIELIIDSSRGEAMRLMVSITRKSLH